MTTLYGSFARIDIADALRVELDGTTVRVLCADGSAALRASALAADVARLERALCDAAARRQQLISELGVITRERDGLRARLDGQAAHRAAGEGVDLSAVLAYCRADADRWRAIRNFGAADAVDALAYALNVRFGVVARMMSELRSEHVERGEQEGVEGVEGVEGGGHRASLSPAMGCRKAHAE